MRATDSARKRRREEDEIRTAQKRVLALLEEELLAMRAERLRESTPSDDRVPPSAPANIVRASGGVRSASKGGRNYSWTKTESLAAVLAREAANNMNQGETQEVRAKDCQSRLIGALRNVETAHAELARKNIPGPFLPIVYRKANVDMTATPEQVATQRGGNAGKSVLLRGDAIHACVVKHILPVARQTWTRRKSGINWTDVCAAVSARVKALLRADPPMSKADRELLSAAQYVWQWTCPENPDVLASSTLSNLAVMMGFALTQSLTRPTEPAISPAKENVPPSESVERDAQTTACQVPVTTVQDEACVPSTDVTPACTPR